MLLVTALFWCVAAYLLAGVVAAPFLAFSAINAMDASAAHGSVAFRLIILPGLVLLWPIVLRKAWLARAGAYELPVPDKPVPPGRLRRLHGSSALALCLLLPALVALALVWRSSDFRDVRAQRVPSAVVSQADVVSGSGNNPNTSR